MGGALSDRAQGRRPARKSDDEEMVYDFTTGLQANKSVSDATFARVEKRFGKKGAAAAAALSELILSRLRSS